MNCRGMRLYVLDIAANMNPDATITALEMLANSVLSNSSFRGAMLPKRMYINSLKDSYADLNKYHHYLVKIWSQN